MRLADLKGYLPKSSFDEIRWKTKRPIQYKLAKNRQTKWGYFKAGLGEKPHIVSINAELNPQAFLFTLIHEIAHVLCWEKHGRKVKPHGAEWKEIFSSMLFKLLKADVFDPDLIKPVFNSIKSPKASCQASVELMKAFSKFDEDANYEFIDEIEKDIYFETKNGKVFLKGQRLRKRFKCQEVATGKWFLFSPIAKVKRI